MNIIIINNYPSKGRRIVVDIYRDTKYQGKYQALVTTLRGMVVLIFTKMRFIFKELIQC